MSLQTMIDENRKFIHVVPIADDFEVQYQICVDPINGYFGTGLWRNTLEKVEQIRALGITHEFAGHPNCLDKRGLIDLVNAGWALNDLTDIIETLQQRLVQHNRQYNAVLDSIGDKQDEIARLNRIINELKEQNETLS